MFHEHPHGCVGYLSESKVCVFFLLLSMSLARGCHAQPVGEPASTTRVETEQADSLIFPSYAEPIMTGFHQIAGIPAPILEKADLRHEWSLRVPLGRAKSLKQIFHHKGRLYTINDRNLLYALDSTNGTTIWSVVLGAPYQQTSPAQFYENNLLFIVGQTFVQVRQTDGSIIKKMEIDFPISTTVARTADRLFLGSANRRFYALNIVNGIVLWATLCAEEPTGTVTIARNKVYFVTKDNILYAADLNQRNLTWSFPTNGSLCGAVVDGEECFLPSGDTAIYCLEADSGELLWKYLAGGSLRELPVVTQDHVYQPVFQRSLLCLDRSCDTEEGALRWELKGGLCLLAENGSTSYVMTQNKELTLMNNITGKPVLSFYVQNLDLYARNKESPMIFMAAKSGTILALKPNHIETPPPAPASQAPPEEAQSPESTQPESAESTEEI